MDRYYLVPQSAYAHAGKTEGQPLNLPSQRLTPLKRLQEDLNHLNQATDLTDEMRWKKYEQLFQTYFDYQNQPVPFGSIQENTSSSNVKTTTTQFDVNTLLNALPKRDRGKAQTLINLLLTQSSFASGGHAWDSKGQLLVNGKPIIGSNYIDLFDYTLRQRTKRPKESPIGWEEFYSILQAVNVPHQVLAPFLLLKSSGPNGSSRIGSRFTQLRKRVRRFTQPLEQVGEEEEAKLTPVKPLTRARKRSLNQSGKTPPAVRTKTIKRSSPSSVEWQTFT